MAGNQYAKNDTDKQRTPQYFFDRLNEEFKFTIDVAADDDPELHRTPKYYTKQDDGLTKKWKGVVWCNPPYSDAQPWIRKAYDESCARGSTVVMLLMASTATKWFGWVFRHAAEIRFVTGRLKFGVHQKLCPFGSMVVIFKGPQEYTAQVSVIERGD
jgi:site-specific DNA-methyltransferase (adenine-specific)